MECFLLERPMFLFTPQRMTSEVAIGITSISQARKLKLKEGIQLVKGEVEIMAVCLLALHCLQPLPNFLLEAGCVCNFL